MSVTCMTGRDSSKGVFVREGKGDWTNRRGALDG